MLVLLNTDYHGIGNCSSTLLKTVGCDPMTDSITSPIRHREKMIYKAKTRLGNRLRFSGIPGLLFSKRRYAPITHFLLAPPALPLLLRFDSSDVCY